MAVDLIWPKDGEIDRFYADDVTFQAKNGPFSVYQTAAFLKYITVNKIDSSDISLRVDELKIIFKESLLRWPDVSVASVHLSFYAKDKWGDDVPSVYYGHFLCLIVCYLIQWEKHYKKTPTNKNKSAASVWLHCAQFTMSLWLSVPKSEDIQSLIGMSLENLEKLNGRARHNQTEKQNGSLHNYVNTLVEQGEKIDVAVSMAIEKYDSNLKPSTVRREHFRRKKQKYRVRYVAHPKVKDLQR